MLQLLTVFAQVTTREFPLCPYSCKVFLYSIYHCLLSRILHLEVKKNEELINLSLFHSMFQHCFTRKERNQLKGNQISMKKVHQATSQHQLHKNYMTVLEPNGNSFTQQIKRQQNGLIKDFISRKNSSDVAPSEAQAVNHLFPFIKNLFFCSHFKACS